MKPHLTNTSRNIEFLKGTDLTRAKALMRKKLKEYSNDLRKSIEQNFTQKELNLIPKVKNIPNDERFIFKVDDQLSQYYYPWQSDFATIVLIEATKGIMFHEYAYDSKFSSMFYNYIDRKQFDNFFKENFDSSKMKKVLMTQISKRINAYAKKFNIPPEAPKNAPLGQFAFGEERDLPEKNTELEKKILIALEKHIAQSHMLDKPYANAFKKILKTKKYSNIIKQQDKPIYRGMILPKDVLRKFLKLKKSEKLKEKGSQNISLTVKPKYGDASSWTHVKNIAKNFSSGVTVRPEKGDFKVILVADPVDNIDKLLDLSALYKELKSSIITEYEKFDRETIGLGPIKVSEIIWEKV